MKFYLTYKPCTCSISNKDHYHISKYDIIPFDVFIKQIEKLEDAEVMKHLDKASDLIVNLSNNKNNGSKI